MSLLQLPLKALSGTELNHYLFRLEQNLVLLRTLAALKKTDAPLTASFREKVDAVMQEHPLDQDAQAAIVEELGEVFAG